MKTEKLRTKAEIAKARLKKKKQEFYRAMVDLSITFYAKHLKEGDENKILREHFLRDYWKSLNGYSVDTIKKGCQFLKDNRTKEFFPVPAEIKEACRMVLPAYTNRVQLPAPEWTKFDKKKYKWNAMFFKYYRAKNIIITDWIKQRDEFLLDKGIVSPAELEETKRKSAQ